VEQKSEYAKEVYEHTIQLSDHIVRENTNAWRDGFHGYLFSSWSNQFRRFRRPPALLWLKDEHAATLRNSSPEQPQWKKDIPLLPFWTFGTMGVGNCAILSFLFALCHVDESLQPELFGFRKDLLAIPRDTCAIALTREGQIAEDHIAKDCREL
jgi:hypothetical protein